MTAGPGATGDTVPPARGRGTGPGRRRDRPVGDAVTIVAFFRNVNLGHPGSPTGDELVAFFGGPESASLFQTNGTLLLTARSARTRLPASVRRLRAAGYAQHLVVRSGTDIRRAVGHLAEPDPGSGVYRTMVSFFDAPASRPTRLPVSSPDHLVELRELGAGVAVSHCWKAGSKAGDVTGFVESVVGVPATTRSLGTLHRLLSRIASSST